MTSPLPQPSPSDGSFRLNDPSPAVDMAASNGAAEGPQPTDRPLEDFTPAVSSPESLVPSSLLSTAESNTGVAELRDEPWRDWNIVELEVVK
jgi:hypothetical protein